MEADDADILQALKNDTLAGMREYLADMLDGGGEAGYSGSDIGECGRILDEYLAKLAGAEHGDDATVRDAAQEAVIALNLLNARCNGHLVETDQREQLCELIQRAAAEVGVGAGEDITEPWREW